MNANKDRTENPLAEPDYDAPLTDDEFARGLSPMRTRRAREATGLSQHAFAARFGIPIGSLRDWEHGRSLPDDVAKALGI